MTLLTSTLTSATVLSMIGFDVNQAKAFVSNRVQVDLQLLQRGIVPEKTLKISIPIIKAMTNSWIDSSAVIHHQQKWDTFLPVQDVINFISKCGYVSSWNPRTNTWSFPNDGIIGAFDDENMKTGVGTIRFTMQQTTFMSHIPIIYRNGTAYMQLDIYQFLMSQLPGLLENFDGKNLTWTITGAPLVSEGKQGTSKKYLGLGGAQNPALPQVPESTLNSAISDAKQSFTSSKGYSPFATATQWFPDPKDVFYNKAFPVAKLQNGRVLQRYPLVVVHQERGTGILEVMEYVGWGQASFQRADASQPSPGWPKGMVNKEYFTYWKVEQLSPKTGMVTAVSNQLAQVQVLWDEFLQGDPSQGDRFPTGKASSAWSNSEDGSPLSDSWAVGSGVTVIPIPGWNPNKNLNQPWSGYTNWN